MALARIARNGLRRSEGAIGNYTSDKLILCRGYSLPSSYSIENVTAGGNFSYLSSIRKVELVNFGSRGIKTVPQYQFAQAERITEESDSEVESPKYPTLEATKPGEKPRVVVLGTGWAACRFLKGIDTKVYDVVCISPRNHMVFTPLLASTCVGTLEFRSVAEPVSRIQSALAKDPNSYFYLANCTSVDTDKHEVSSSKFCVFLTILQTLLCILISCHMYGEIQHIEINHDNSSQLCLIHKENQFISLYNATPAVDSYLANI